MNTKTKLIQHAMQYMSVETIETLATKALMEEVWRVIRQNRQRDQNEVAGLVCRKLQTNMSTTSAAEYAQECAKAGIDLRQPRPIRPQEITLEDVAVCCEILNNSRKKQPL